MDDIGTSEIEWTRTSLASIQLWIVLNERMDEQMMAGKLLLPVSGEFAELLIYMNRYTDEYLQYVYIEESLPSPTKRDLYYRLGRYIRSRGVIPSYLDQEYHQNHYYISIDRSTGTDLVPGIHYNLRLDEDILYSDVPHSDYPPAILEALLASQVSTVTGIMHTA